jgi:glycosyltransferase involved in cell wall biosynthesis
VYPSIHEGWGLPVGEAAWFGKYVIAAKVTSLPEVCGDLMDYVDPYDVHDIAGRIGFALDNPAYVKEKELAIRRASLRSWDDVADMLLNALET